MRKGISRIGIVIWCLFLSSLVNAEHLTQHVPFPELVNKSTLIVEGAFVSKQGVWNEARTKIYTLNKIAVSKSFKGGITDTVLVLTRGGEVDGQIELVTPALTLRGNSVGMFLLEESPVSVSYEGIVYSLVSEPQSFLGYNTRTAEAGNAFHKFENYDSSLYNEIESITGESYTTNRKNRVSARPTPLGEITSSATVSGMSPTSISAGTFSVLTITGSGFGTTQGNGRVEFANADDGGVTNIAPPAGSYVSWSNSEIQVQVPDGAGTGDVVVVDSAGQSTTFSGLTVLYNVSTYTSGDQENPLMMGDYTNNGGNGSGGYTFEMTSDFFSSTDAKNDIEFVFAEWQCATGINYTLSSGTTSATTVTSDDINIIAWETSAEIGGEGTLGLCTKRLVGCGNSFVVNEIDLSFNSEKSWSYGAASPEFSTFDFRSVAMHEMGHAAFLGHEIDTEDVMHYSVSNGVEKRTIDSEAINGVNYVTNLSVNRSYGCSNLNTYVHGIDCPNESYITPEVCGGTASIDQIITVSEISGATQYRYEFYDLGNNFISRENRATNSLVLNSVDSPELNAGTTYTLQVKAFTSTETIQLLEGCSITTYSPETTQLTSSDCGLVMTDRLKILEADEVTGADRYLFTFTADGEQTVIREQSGRFYNYPFFSNNFTPGVVYNVTVVARVNGVHSDPGNVCTIQIAGGSEGQIEDCGTVYTSWSGNVNAVAQSGAERYSFIFNGGGAQLSYTTSKRYAKLRNVSGLVGDTDYSVRVRVQKNGIYGTVGDLGACIIRTPSGVPTKEGVAFVEGTEEIFFYPNPTRGENVYFTSTIHNVEVIDVLGNVQNSNSELDYLETSELNPGLYIIKADEGMVKLIVE